VPRCCSPRPTDRRIGRSVGLRVIARACAWSRGLSSAIHDLTNVNPKARISVKLVSEIGVGTVAAGVSKAHADHVTISGYDGGTGASPLTSIKHAGSPWEIGLAETHQTLVLNNLRGRIAVQVDGGMRTGRDVVIGALLGADEFGFATAPLIVSGCIMMRKCHLNTCPVGVATQDPELRKRFTGQPEHIINYMFFVAEEMRRIMARLGYRTVSEMIGQSDRLEMRRALDHWKARGLDFTRLLMKPKVGLEVAISNRETQDHGLDQSLDHDLIKQAQPALQRGEPVAIETRVHNYNRTFGAMLSANFAVRHNATVKRYYQRKRAKTNGVVPIKTVAHKLARACYYILRDGTDFAVSAMMGCAALYSSYGSHGNGRKTSRRGR